MAALCVFRAGRWVSLVRIVFFVHFVAIWGLIFVTGLGVFVTCNSWFSLPAIHGFRYMQ